MHLVVINQEGIVLFFRCIEIHSHYAYFCSQIPEPFSFYYKYYRLTPSVSVDHQKILLSFYQTLTFYFQIETLSIELQESSLRYRLCSDEPLVHYCH